MVSKLQAYIGQYSGSKSSSLSFAFILSLILFSGGCATVQSAGDSVSSHNYESYVKDVDSGASEVPNKLRKGYYLNDSVRRKVVDESVASIRKGTTEIAELYMLRKEYLDYSRALIELGQFKKASVICDQGIEIGNIIANALVDHDKRDLAKALSRNITKWVMNASILPHFDNEAYLRRLYLYKTYVTWFTTGDKDKSFNSFEKFLSTDSLNEDKIFLLMDRGSFYDGVMGNYRKSLNEYLKASEEIDKMHILNTDMRYVYSLEVSSKMSDIYMKLGELNNAEKVMAEGEEKRKGLLYQIGGLIASIQQSKVTIIRSKMGGLYALLQDFNKAKALFDKAYERVKDVDPNSPDLLDQRVISTYYVNYGAYYLGLKGKYKEGAEYVDKGIEHMKPYYLEAIEHDPNIEKAYLFSAELHLLNGSTDKALTRIKKATEFAESHHNRVAKLTAHTLSGRIYYANGEKKQAKVAYEKALDLTKNIESTENWKLFYGLGQVYEDSADHAKALKYYRDAVKEVEKLWDGRFKDAQKQVSFIDNRLVVFEPIIRILAKQGKAEDAINYMERSKSRTFFESSVFAADGQGAVPVSLSLADADKLEKVRNETASVADSIDKTTSKLQTINEKLGESGDTASSRGVGGVREVKGSKKKGGDPKSVSVKERKKLEAEKAKYEKEVKEQEMRLEDLAGQEQALTGKAVVKSRNIADIDPLTAAKIKKMIPENVAILEYYVGERSVIAAVVTKKGFFVKELAITSRQLRDDVMAFRSAIEDVNDYRALSHSLYASLIKPFEKQLAGVDSIGVVPHGVLHYLPFQALVVRDDSEKGISPDLISTEKTLMAMVECNTQRSNRGVSVREGYPTKDAVAGKSSDQKIKADFECVVARLKRGVGVREGSKPPAQTSEVQKMSMMEARGRLETVRAQIDTERSQKKISENRPTFLIDRYKLFYAPSSTILNFVRNSNGGKKEKLLAIGSPPALDVKDLKEAGLIGVSTLERLPATKTEVQEVGSLFASKAVFTEEAATESIAKNNAPNYDLLLFSTHGMLNRREPLKSSVFFNKDANNDGRLTVSEIEKMGLNANLIVLSACQTGLMAGYEGVSEDVAEARFPHGDDLVGLQRAFMKSGSASVMSTLWEVSDDSTSAMVIDFFKRYQGGKDKTTSLQEAELALIQTKKEWEHPYFWAPFVLSGDWR